MSLAPPPPTPGVTTSERILAAALDAFAGRGIEATSLDAVASGAGVRKQTLLYWFPSKEALLFAVIDDAVSEVGDHLAIAVRGAGPTEADRLVAVVDAIFRLGTNRPQLLRLLREVALLGGVALDHLARATDPMLDRAAEVLAADGDDTGRARVSNVLIDAGARVVALATEAQLRAQLGLPPDLAWLRNRRASLIGDLLSGLTGRDGAVRT